MSFKTWIKQFLEEESPSGNLARDIKDDNNFPMTVSRKPMMLYLIHKRKHPELIMAFEDAYQAYKVFEKKKNTIQPI